jgi:hypothetical protein
MKKYVESCTCFVYARKKFTGEWGGRRVTGPPSFDDDAPWWVWRFLYSIPSLREKPNAIELSWQETMSSSSWHAVFTLN